MKSRISLLVVMLFMVITGITAENFSRDVVLISNNGRTILLKSSATSFEKKQALPLAIKSAFDTYLFAGIEGVGEGKALLPESARTNNENYFRRLYDESRYKVFVKGEIKDIEKHKKQSDGSYLAIVTIEIYHQTLEKDLISNKIMESEEAKQEKIEEIENQILMPSIMVIPYRKSGETFKTILENDFDKRIAVGKVQDEFREKGITTVDFEAKYNAALRSNEFEVSMADAFDTQLIKNSGADVYVTVDINKSSTTRGSRVGLSLKAYDTATGAVLASKQEAGDYYRTNAFDKLCMFSIKKLSKEFLDDVAGSLANKVKKGSGVALRVSIGGTSYKSLDDEVGGSGFGISDYVRSWLRKNAVKGVFHQQGKTDLAIIFDNINIPNKNELGEFQDSTDFAVRLTRYLKKLGVNASNRIDGNTIYITITD
ncbi:MAG: DUF6175 family protein [Muribaculaceae bacterium]|nr:DUF6175 family protein [Muribaculaceae bacterium]